MLKSIILGTLLVASAGIATAQERHGGPGPMLGHADQDGDGTITRDEFRNARIAAFTRLDTNSDGFLDTADRPAKRHRPADAQPSGEQDDAARSARRGKKGWHHRGGGQGMLQRLDANADGKLSKDEFVDGAMPMFDKADTDGNGVLDTRELDAMKSAAKQRAREMRQQRAKPADETAI